MAELLLKDVSEETVRRLERRARAHGRSVEAEHRAIVEEAVEAEPAASSGKAPTTQDIIQAFQDMPWLGDLDPDELRDRNDTGREVYISLEGLDRLAEALRRGQ